MTAEWPPEAREAVARAIAPAIPTYYTPERYADAALAALAPFLAAKIAEAKREGMRDIVEVAARLLTALDNMHQRGETLSARASIAAAELAAILARAEEIRP